MELFIVVGILSLVFGLFFIASPTTLRTMSERTNRAIMDLEAKAFTYRLGVGLSLIIASLLFFFVAWYINVKG